MSNVECGPPLRQAFRCGPGEERRSLASGELSVERSSFTGFVILPLRTFFQKCGLPFYSCNILGDADRGARRRRIDIIPILLPIFRISPPWHGLCVIDDRLNTGLSDPKRQPETR
jgi:hypothetical protein